MELLSRTAADAGHSLEAHTGHVGGRGSDRLASGIERADLVVIVIETNSHGAMLRAKEIARTMGRPVVTIRKGSVSALKSILNGAHAA